MSDDDICTEGQDWLSLVASLVIVALIIVMVVEGLQ